jgi:hypothetical protein
MSNRATLALGLALLSGLPLFAVSTKFSDFTPLTSSASLLPVDGPEEATPITLPDPKWSQRRVADRRTQNNLVPNSNSGNWDRPEDMVLQTLRDGTQLVYFATTDSDVNATGGDGTSRVYTLNLSTNEVKLFAAPQSKDVATGLAASGVDRTIEISAPPQYEKGSKQ